MKPRLIATDLDGTAIKNDHMTMTDRTKEVFRRAAEGGIFVVPVTGRSLGVLPCGILPSYSYIVTSNGASVYDVKNRETIITHHLTKKESETAWSILSGTSDLVELFIKNKMAIDRHSFENVRSMALPAHHLEYYANGDPLVLDSYSEFIKSDGMGIEKFYIPVNGSKDTEKVRSALTETGLFDVSTSGANNVELNKRGVNKGATLRELCKMLGIDMKDVVAFGDESNDITMLESVGWGVAVANAKADVHEAAKYSTLPNEEDGLAVFLEETFGI
ncbi:MAG: HAD-IIB family hydrolase [Oscillospiraceae bacterium]